MLPQKYWNMWAPEIFMQNQTQSSSDWWQEIDLNLLSCKETAKNKRHWKGNKEQNSEITRKLCISPTVASPDRSLLFFNKWFFIVTFIFYGEDPQVKDKWKCRQPIESSLRMNLFCFSTFFPDTIKPLKCHQSTRVFQRLFDFFFTFQKL